jgi:aminoglycoside phosphotransferase family enzyme
MELMELTAGLSDPSAYTFGPKQVLVHRIRISLVFLAGKWAYIIKEPVRLGFADYGTLGRQLHFCHEEVRLNRRLAPDVCRCAVPVTREGPSVRMEGTASPLEWAVKMRRLPFEATPVAGL